MPKGSFGLERTEDNMDEPLIYTTLGNVPIKDLQYQHYWLEDDTAITLVEEYRYQGELVKRNAHARLKKGLDAALESQLAGM
jgi:hypothetical protein